MGAKIIRGEDTEVKYYLNNDDGSSDSDESCGSQDTCKTPYPLTGCTGVSGVFLQADSTWIVIGGGTVISADLGIASVPLSKAQTALLYVGKKLKTQLILDFNGLTRKVQFDCALEVVDDVTNQSLDAVTSCASDSSDIRFC